MKIFIAIGILLLATSAFWLFGLAPRMIERIPAGWSWETNYIGTQTYPDPVTRQIPEKDATSTYSQSAVIVSEAGRPAAIEVENRYVIHDVNTGKLIYEYDNRATVDPQTGAHLKDEYRGDYLVFPRNAGKKTYKLRFSYLKGVPLAFQNEVEIGGVETYLYSYKGRGEYTESYAGTAEYPGVKTEPGQELRCADDQFIFKAWVEPVTGKIVKIQEGCPSGDYVYDVATGKQLEAVDRWGGVTAGDDVVIHLAAAKRERTKLLWITRYIPLTLLLAGLLCFGLSLLSLKLPKIKMLRLRSSIAAKWFALQVVGLGIVLCFVGFYQYRNIRDTAYKNVEDSGDAVSQTIKEMLAEHPELFDAKILQPVLLRLTTKIASIQHISITDSTRRIIVDSVNNNLAIGEPVDANTLDELFQGGGDKSSSYTSGGGNFLRLSYPLEGRYDLARQSNIVGVLTMDFSLSEVEENIGAAFLQTMQILAGLLFLFWLIQYVLARRGFLRWLHHLTFTAGQFGKGDYSARALVPTTDEIGQVADAFNGMATEIEKSSRELQLEIAERKQAQEANARLTNIVEAATDFVCIADKRSRIIYINNAGRKMMGIGEHEDVSAMTILDLHPEWSHPTIFNEIVPSLLQQGAWIGDLALVQRDGLEMPVSLSCLSHKSPTGEVENFSAFMRDISTSKQMEIDLRGARDAALDSARLKSEFLANMSHEIRTPMNGVIGMTGLLLDTELDDEQRDFTETVRSSADSLLTIINDILDFSKIEAGKLHFEKLDFDLRNVVETTVELLAERAQAKGIELASLVDSNVPVQVRGDAGRLRQVLVNLTGNAVKFTESGEITVSVTKECETETHVKIRYAVSDTGIGISPDVQRRLFQAFVQADGSTTRKYGGTGLGLAISKQLVELMGGEIGVESAPGEGSTFWFTARLEKQTGEIQIATAQPRADLHGLRVLVVDDNATNRRILVHQTTAWGMIAGEAGSGAAALDVLRAAREKGEPFDVALLDFHMPGMDGFELTRAIKTDAELANVRLVLMPSYGNRGDGQLAREIGIAAYLMKPVRQSQLFDCLATVMVEAEANAPEASRTSQLVTRHSLKEAVNASRTRILIAEDNSVNQKVAIRQMGKLGYQVDVAANGLEALEALTKVSYDIVLMDCQMPLMDGYEATAEIRRREGTNKHTVIIAMTAHALQGDREKCLAAGMDDYLSKPVKTEELQDVLARWERHISAATEVSDMTSCEGETTPKSPPVDMDRLRDVSGGDEELLQELVGLYLQQTSEGIENLTAAVASGDVREVKRLAHSCVGGSATCGMNAIVAPLRELERLIEEEYVENEATRLCLQVGKEFERIKLFLEESLNLEMSA